MPDVPRQLHHTGGRLHQLQHPGAVLSSARQVCAATVGNQCSGTLMSLR